MCFNLRKKKSGNLVLKGEVIEVFVLLEAVFELRSERSDVELEALQPRDSPSRLSQLRGGPHSAALHFFYRIFVFFSFLSCSYCFWCISNEFWQRKSIRKSQPLNILKSKPINSIYSKSCPASDCSFCSPRTAFQSVLQHPREAAKPAATWNSQASAALSMVHPKHLRLPPWMLKHQDLLAFDCFRKQNQMERDNERKCHYAIKAPARFLHGCDRLWAKQLGFQNALHFNPSVMTLSPLMREGDWVVSDLVVLHRMLGHPALQETNSRKHSKILWFTWLCLWLFILCTSLWKIPWRSLWKIPMKLSQSKHPKKWIESSHSRLFSHALRQAPEVISLDLAANRSNETMHST